MRENDVEPTEDALEQRRRRKEILSLYEKQQYLEARSKIFRLSEKEQLHGSMIITNADCFYEEKDDLNALREYVKYLGIYPKGKAKNFVLFGIAMILKNLDLQKEAYSVLESIDPFHEGVDKEKRESLALLEQQHEATLLLKLLLRT